MPLPASGPLTLADIQGEFGGSNPISLGEYYAGGAYVQAAASGTYGAVPSSGAISIRNFYGTSAGVVTITDQNISDTDFGSAQAYYFVTAGGQIAQSTQSGGTGPTNIEQWVTPTSAVTLFEARVTITSGALTGGSGAGTWLPLSTTRNWFVENSSSGTIEECIFTIEIRRTSTGTVQDSATITLYTEVF
jgi:hypothetical protein